MKTDDTQKGSPSLFRRTLIQVLSVQLIALLVLWLLQARYGS